MALDPVADRLRELAEAESGLRRSRAMAQLWAEIRKASPEERRVFGHALADRFAPQLAERFESITGIEGPEFIELVRGLIDLEADDIRSVISDLADLAEDPTAGADEVGVAEAEDFTGRVTGGEGRADLVDEIFDRISDGTADEHVSEAAERLMEGDGVDSDALAQAVEALDELPGAEPAPSAFDEARERLRRLDERDEAPGPTVTEAIPDEPAPPTEHRIEHPPAVVRDAHRPDDDVREPGDLAERLQATPDGWRRRRMLGAAIRSGEVDVRRALTLSESLSSATDRAWIIGDLIERGLDADERSLVRSRDLPPHLARRLERAP